MDHLLRQGLRKEYITDGRHYFSADGKKRYSADEYYRVIEADIENSIKLLPLTVSGDVAWVTAQTTPNHLCLTIIDSGYINPKTKTTTVSFHAVEPTKMVDLLDGKIFNISNPSKIKVDIPCGMFRFIDIELKESLLISTHRGGHPVTKMTP